MSLTDNIFAEIKEKHVTPTARWKFVLTNSALWIAGIFSVIAGTIGVSTLFHIVDDGDWDIYQYFDRTFLGHIFTVFPYFWLAVCVIFIFLTYYTIRNTKKGYRYTTHMIVLVGLLISIIAGSGFFILGVGEGVDELFSDNISLYTALPHQKKVIWNHPEHGLISGVIKEIKNDNEFILEDFSKNEWSVKESSTTWKGVGKRDVGSKIKLIGTKESDFVFIPQEIRPW
ncbi:MAG: hypothetical protein WCW78_02520 [Candidatus Paceibacterota bacterium]|jgi:hypothetical protein